MAGKIKLMIDKIIDKKAHGNPAIARVSRAKLVLKGINPDSYTVNSEDSAWIIDRVRQIADDMGVTLEDKIAVAVASSSNRRIAEAVIEIRDQLSTVEPQMVVYFASSNYETAQLSAAMHDAFLKTTVFGCTTAGEIVSGKMLKNSIVAMAFSKDIIEDAVVEVIPDVRVKGALQTAFSSFESYYHIAMQDANPEKYFGIILFDGLSCVEEEVMDRIGNLTNITFVGGSAGDDERFIETFVYAQGKAYNNAVVIALVKAGCRFDVVKTQSFRSLGKKLTATKVDEDSRTVFEFDGKPAALAYAEAIGQSVNTLPNYFIYNPLGLVSDHDLFVRSPQQVKDGSVIFYCNIKEGTELQVLQATDILQDTQKVVRKKIVESGPLKALLQFNCISRSVQLENQGQTEEYGRIFETVPTIGFNTYGEAYIGHVNQSAIMLTFG